MKIVGREVLERFCRKHADGRRWIENWLADVEMAAWNSPHDVRKRYATASFLPGALVVFNVKGNAYRLEVSVAYRTAIVSIHGTPNH